MLHFYRSPCLLVIITLVTAFILGVGNVLSDEYCTKDSCRQTIFNEKLNIVTLTQGEHSTIISLPGILKDASVNYSPTNEPVTSILWPRYGSIHVTEETIGGVECHVIKWVVLSKDFEPHDCISLADAYWYGGSELHYQRWPFEDSELPLQAFVSEDIVVKTKSLGNVVDPFWISSKGVGVYVDDTVPLHIEFNASASQQLCFIAKFNDIYMKLNQEELPSLRYTICKDKNILSVFQKIRVHLMDSPRDLPDIRMIKSPIWSTWAKYKVNIDQNKIIQYADEIVQHGFSNSQLEIDDMFSTKYGDFDFDPKKFPNPKDMTTQLKKKGFRTTVWITPFANLDSKAFIEGTELGYWLKDKSGNVPALVKWWQGIGAVLDPTNPKAATWYNNRLELMKTKYGIDSFKFDAGEMTFLPTPLYSYKHMSNPNFYTTKYVETVSYHGDMIEVRCGYRSQGHAIFVRMADKESRWGYDNGIKTIIPTALTFGILGYPFILPDMIGGNGYGEVLQQDVILPNRELYIRWLQLTAYLPAMQFSFTPWDYDDEVVQIALDMVKVHETVVTPIVIEAGKESIKYGFPIIRPMWWVDPDDQETYTIDSQFMVGKSLMVAPILDVGARKRDIYFPSGKWKDNRNGNVISGGQWLRDYEVNLNQIATFEFIE